MRASYRHGLTIALSLLLFLIALLALRRVLAEFTLAEVEAEIRGLQLSQIALALLGVCASYTLLTVFDWQGVRLAGKQVPLKDVAAIAFIANAFSHSLGMAALTGGAVRARAYAALGFSAIEVGQVIACASLSFALGALLWLGLALLFATGHAVLALHVPAWIAQAAGALALLVLTSLVLLSARGRRSVALAGRSIALPGPRDTALMLVVSAVELSCAALALYALLPDTAQISFLGFCGLYLLALIVGLVSTVPAGLGVFEASLIALLPQLPAHSLLGAIVVYRALYYLAPLLLAMALLVGKELRAQSAALRTGALWFRRIGRPLVAPAIALAVFAAGASLLLSGAIPVGHARTVLLRGLVPLPVFELSHLVSSALGVALLLLARGLHNRLDAAWALTLLALVGAAVTLLLAGLRWELALALLALVPPLLITRRYYNRPTPLSAQVLSWSWIRNVVLVAGASVWIGLFAHQHVEYANELWWKFTFASDAPRMLRANLLVVLALAGIALWRLLQPLAAPAAIASDADRQRALPVIAQSDRSDANLALAADKQLLFAPADAGLLMYQRSGRFLIAMADPVGARDAVNLLAWRLRELADSQGLDTVFYEVGAEHLPVYLDLGLALVKLGEEAVVPLADFALEGRARAELRGAQRHGVRSGASFAVLPARDVAAALPALRAVSDDWLARRNSAEKCFSLGWFDEAYIARFDCAVVRVDGAIVAFANIWRGREGTEVSIDLMRYSQAAPKGVMDFLFVELLLWAKTAGYRAFSLGMAPLSGLSKHRLAPAWHKLGSLIWQHGEAFYHFEGLRKYKEKFAPQWRPRYLAAPGGLRLPQVLLEVSRLIAGRTLDRTRISGDDA